MFWQRGYVDFIWYYILTYETDFALFLAVLENSVLLMGYDNTHETLHNEVSWLQT